MAYTKNGEKKAKTPEQALAALMRLCSRAEKSGGDALRLMRGWGIESETERQAILDRLKKDKFIDDNRFSRAYVRDKSSLSGWGAHKIRAGLKAKGVHETIIKEALALIDENKNSEKLEVILRRKAATLKSQSAYDKKAKLIRFGLSRGFDYELVAEVVDAIIRDKD